MAAKDLSHAELVTAFEARFDYQSARIVAGEVLGKAGVAKKDAYPGADLDAVRKAIETALGAAGGRVIEALARSAGPAKAEPAKPEPAKAAAAPMEAAPAAEAPPAAESAPEAETAPAADAGEGDEKKAEKKKK